ncbi:hypothetical protein BN2127_JRS10_04945 [Bacillus subtilis]|nr:hypothetical protein BN2127_JRS10_04945 [Bacillus subtilis]
MYIYKENKKIYTFLVLLGICIFSGLISALMQCYVLPRGNHIPNLNVTALKTLSFVVGCLTPCIMIFGYFIFLIIVAMFQIIQSKTYKFEIFSMCIVAYIPILIGSLINLILSLIFGYYSAGYISVYQFFPSGILQDMMKQLAPFQILSVLFMSYLYTNYYNKGKINMIIIFSTWLILSTISVLML